MNGSRSLRLSLTAAALIVGCADSGSPSATPISTTTVTTTEETSTTTAVATTTAATTPALSEPTTAATTVPTPAAACAEPATIPSGATQLVAINGDIDGDTLNDVVTSYSLDGRPHVHATLATGGNSDTEIPIGNADTVSIQFMDFDHSAGADIPPPVAVLAIGPTKAGTAVGTFLTLTPQYCIRAWHAADDTLFSFRISAEPVYQGLMCDGAAGSIIHSLTTAEQNPGGDWNVTIQPFGHNFTTVDMHDSETVSVPDSPDFAAQYLDITSCGLTLFP